MILIELALLRLSRFKRLALLDTQGLELLSRCIREFGGRDARDAYVIGLVTMLAHSAHSAMQVSGREPWRVCS